MSRNIKQSVGGTAVAAPLCLRSRARLHGLIWLFYASAFLFTSSGRLNNWDPLAQLQASTALVTTGSLGADEHPMPNVPDLWVENAHGRYFEAHDLGGALLLTPAAAIGVALEGRSHKDLVRDPPWSARVLGTLEYALVGALGCYAVYRLFAGVYDPRSAFLLSLTFAATTTYWAYTRIAYDILGGCVGVCLQLWFCQEALQRPVGNTGDAVKIGLATALACLFRFSLAPFLAFAIVGVTIVLRHRWDWRERAAAIGVFTVGIAPDIYYNFVRTAMLLNNAATGHAPAIAALHGTLLDGIYGLIFSPNWGILWFAPVFLLLLFLPWAWRSATITLRQILACFVAPGLAYLMVIAKLNNWTGYSGWGPRYLLPLVPIFFVGVAVVTMRGWVHFRRPLIVVLALSAILNLPSVLVNFRAAQSAYPGGSDIHARLPRQQLAAWGALVAGVSGQSIPVLTDASTDPIRHHAGDFPDLWTVRLMAVNRAGAVIGPLTAAILLVCMIATWRQVQRRMPEHLPAVSTIQGH